MAQFNLPIFLRAAICFRPCLCKQGGIFSVFLVCICFFKKNNSNNNNKTKISLCSPGCLELASFLPRLRTLSLCHDTQLELNRS